MSEPQRDTPASAAASASASTPGKTPPPAEFASQVATLIGEDPPYHSDDLPLWSRLRHSPRRSSRWWPRLMWCVTAVLLTIALLRIAVHDGVVVLTWLNAFTLYLYLPAYLVLAYAAWTCRWWLATASVAVITLHIAWVAPDFRAPMPYVPPEFAAGESVPVKVFYANVRGGSNFQFDEVLAEARAADPDVIIFVEMKRDWWQELLRRQPLPDYPYGSNLAHKNFGDVGVFSRLSVRRMEEVIVERRGTLVLDIRLDQGAAARSELKLVALHSPRPNVGPSDDYYVFWDRILSVLARSDGPEVVIGDFNATQHSRVYRQLLALGLRSAHEDCGRGYATTWPNSAQPFPPIRIDQAMLSPEVECVSIREGTGPGSDHKPLILDLRVHLPNPGATDG